VRRPQSPEEVLRQGVFVDGGNVPKVSGLTLSRTFAPEIKNLPETLVLSVGRIESVKRVDLLVSAMARVDKPIRLVVAGEGTQRANVEKVAEDAGVGDRVTFLGAIDDDRLLELYREALAVLYPPYDEDFGYVTLEAFLSRKPVVTATDSGGPNEFVVDGVNGFVREPAPEGFAEAINTLARDRRRTAALGEAGYERARTVTWDGVIERLLA